MSINRRPITKVLAVSLAATAVAAASQIGAQPVSAGADARLVGTTADNQGDPNAVPPILRPARPSELAAIRRAEAQEALQINYDPLATARYSSAEMSAYASEGK
jgi:hypothetical protein